MTIKVREPGDAFKRQVSEFVPVKKRRPWRDEEPTTEVREVQGASSTDAKFALDEDTVMSPSTNAKSALDEKAYVKDSEAVISYPDDVRGNQDSASYARHIRQPFRSVSIKAPSVPMGIMEALPGTRKTRSTFVFEVALRRIDHPTAALLYCYLSHQAEELGSVCLKITHGEMAEALCLSKRTIFDATKRLTELRLFENVNSGKTTVPVVRLGFE